MSVDVVCEMVFETISLRWSLRWSLRCSIEDVRELDGTEADHKCN